MESNNEAFSNSVILNCELLFFLDTQDKSFNAATRKKELKIRSDSNVEKTKDEVLEEANQIVENNNLKKILCPYLKVISNDISELAKIVVTVLLPLSIVKSIIIPEDSLVYSGIVYVIFSSGVKGFCGDFSEKK